jgi:hypothetical protein
MAERQVEDTLDVSNFTVGTMLRTGLAIRKQVKRAESMEEAANTIVRLLYERCADPATGERSCVLVRFYKTHLYGELPPELRSFADAILGDRPASKGMRCLTLMATIGDEPSWNDRRASRGHQAIPLPSADFVDQAPMIRQLIEDLGLDVEEVVRGTAQPPRAGDARNYDVFHVEEAKGSPHIPAQREFVEEHGVRSVVGFGGLLRSGELFAAILFSRHHIPAESAGRFRAIALDIRSSLFTIDEESVWMR